MDTKNIIGCVGFVRRGWEPAEACVVAVDVKDALAGRRLASVAHFPNLTTATFGRCATALADAMRRCDALVATDDDARRALEAAFVATGYGQETPRADAWVALRDDAFVTKLEVARATLYEGKGTALGDSTLMAGVVRAFCCKRLVDFFSSMRAAEPTRVCEVATKACDAARDAVAKALRKTLSEPTSPAANPKPAPVVSTTKTLASVLKKTDDEGRARGPFQVKCRASRKAIGFYKWAWDDKDKPPRRVSWTRKTIDVPEDKYVLVKKEDVPFDDFRDGGRCVGVYTESEKLLRLF